MLMFLGLAEYIATVCVCLFSGSNSYDYVGNFKLF